MSELLDRTCAYLRSRSPQERWVGALALCVLSLILVHALGIAPLDARLRSVQSETEVLDMDLPRVQRMAAEVRRLQAELARVEARIQPGEKTNLFTVLENLAAEAQIRDQLESIKPKQPSGNPRYPETRVEVRLRDATLKQAIQYLYRIETAPMLLIIRSIRIKARDDDSQLLDVNFSVSSFERA